MVKLTKMLVELKTYKFWHSLGCSIKKNQAVTLMNPVLRTYIHYLCAIFAQSLVPHGAGKIYLVLHGTSKTIGCCILGGVYQIRVARP
jgi:hypothetical protein